MSDLRRFSGVYLKAGQMRRITFEAADLEDARQQAEHWGVGVEGEAGPIQPPSTVEKQTYTMEEVMATLQVSRTTVKRLLWRRKLKRIAGVRKVLVTRQSLEEYSAGRN